MEEFMFIILIIFFILLLFIPLLFRIKVGDGKVGNDDSKEASCDVILHHTADKIPITQCIREYCKYFPDLVSSCFAAISIPYSETFGFSNMPTVIDASYTHQNNSRFSSKYLEVFNNTDYIGLSREKFTTQTPVELYKLFDNLYLYILEVNRLNDDKKFYNVLIRRITTKSVKNDDGYKALYQAISFLKKFYPGDYIIRGSFGIIGSESVFLHLLPDYLVCDFTKIPTRLSTTWGLMSADGIIVSPNLYNRIEYYTTFSETESYVGLLLIAKCYQNHKEPGVFISENYKLDSWSKHVSEKLKDKSYYGDIGIFDPEKHKLEATEKNKIKLETPTNIEKVNNLIPLIKKQISNKSNLDVYIDSS